MDGVWKALRCIRHQKAKQCSIFLFGSMSNSQTLQDLSLSLSCLSVLRSIERYGNTRALPSLLRPCCQLVFWGVRDYRQLLIRWRLQSFVMIIAEFLPVVGSYRSMVLWCGLSLSSALSVLEEGQYSLPFLKRPGYPSILSIYHPSYLFLSIHFSLYYRHMAYQALLCQGSPYIILPIRTGRTTSLPAWTHSSGSVSFFINVSKSFLLLYLLYTIE